LTPIAASTSVETETVEVGSVVTIPSVRTDSGIKLDTIDGVIAMQASERIATSKKIETENEWKKVRLKSFSSPLSIYSVNVFSSLAYLIEQ
jgi:hypothetical protein